MTTEKAPQMTYKHTQTDFGTNPAYRQHFVSDGQGRPFLRTVSGFRDSEADLAVGKWLDEAVQALNSQQEKSAPA
jgi:hypothetical protein